MLKKRNDRVATTNGSILRSVCALTLCLLLLLSTTLLTGCDKEGEKSADKASADSAATEQETTAPAMADKETFDIDLGFVTLKYPEKWKDKLVLKGDGKHQADESFTLSFLMGDQPVFDLNFNSEKGDLLGTIHTDKDTTLRIEPGKVDISSSKGEMLEDINVILTHLKKDYNFTAGEEQPENDDSVFEIKTNVTSLYYPARWKDKVTVEVEDKKVSFSEGDTPLFDICFEKVKGTLVGTYGDTPIYIVDHKVETSDQIMMLEDVNIILQHLAEDDKYTPA